MVFATIKLRNLILFLLIIISIVFISMEIYTVFSNTVNADIYENRILLADKFGYDIRDLEEISDIIVLPKSATNEFKEYNLIQNSSGFDLIAYLGLSVVRYRYKQINQDYILDFIVKDGRLIGADLFNSESYVYYPIDVRNSGEIYGTD